VRAVLASIVVALGACSRSREAPTPAAIAISAEPATPPPPLASAAPRPAAIALSVLPILVEIERLLERDPLTLEEVMATVGPIDEAQSKPTDDVVMLRPRLPWVRKARVMRYGRDKWYSGPEFGRGAIFILELHFVPEARPTIAELGGIFGERHGGAYPDLHGFRSTTFNPPTKGRRWSVTVLADLLPCFDPHGWGDPPPYPCTPVAEDSLAEKVELLRNPKG
jgi:hypothetical protein